MRQTEENDRAAIQDKSVECVHLFRTGHLHRRIDGTERFLGFGSISFHKLFGGPEKGRFSIEKRCVEQGCFLQVECYKK